MDLKLDRILSSPLPRALKTAEIVADVLGLSAILETADALAANRDAASICEWLPTRTENRVMLVGHNPSLSEMIGLLVTGGLGPPSPCELRKGGIAALQSSPGQGMGMRLDWLARPRLLRKLVDSCS